VIRHEYKNEETPDHCKPYASLMPNSNNAVPVQNVINSVGNTGRQLQISNPNANLLKMQSKQQPVQLFWELRFNKLKAVDSRLADEIENFKQEINFTQVPKFKTFDISNESEMRSVAASSYQHPSRTMLGQTREFNKNARVFIDREQPVMPAFSVKDEEVKLQEHRVKKLRKQLALTLQELNEFDYDVSKVNVDDLLDEAARMSAELAAAAAAAANNNNNNNNNKNESDQAAPDDVVKTEAPATATATAQVVATERDVKMIQSDQQVVKTEQTGNNSNNNSNNNNDLIVLDE